MPLVNKTSWSCHNEWQNSFIALVHTCVDCRYSGNELNTNFGRHHFKSCHCQFCRFPVCQVLRNTKQIYFQIQFNVFIRLKMIAMVWWANSYFQLIVRIDSNCYTVANLEMPLSLGSKNLFSHHWPTFYAFILSKSSNSQSPLFNPTRGRHTHTNQLSLSPSDM